LPTNLEPHLSGLQIFAVDRSARFAALRSRTDKVSLFDVNFILVIGKEYTYALNLIHIMCLLEIVHSYTCKDCYADYAFVNYNAVMVLNLLLVVK
jgi:hypothetical protein